MKLNERVDLTRIAKQTYDVLIDGDSIGVLYKEKHPGQIRSLRKYIGSWDAYWTWDFAPNDDEKRHESFDSFKEAKAWLREQK